MHNNHSPHEVHKAHERDVQSRNVASVVLEVSPQLRTSSFRGHLIAAVAHAVLIRAELEANVVDLIVMPLNTHTIT